LIILGPSIALAALGVRRPGRDFHERMLLLWPLAALVAYLVPTGGRFEVIAGLSVPLAVLIVRGWERLKVPRGVTALALAAMLAGAIVPLIVEGERSIRSGEGTVWIRDGDRAAMRYMASAPGGGSVLADSHVAAATVALTGRPMWAAHANWSPDYVGRATLMNEAVAGKLTAADLQRLVAATRARFLFRDCGRSVVPVQRFGAVVTARRRFGCADVLELSPQAS
jgi:hypothetical protein